MAKPLFKNSLKMWEGSSWSCVCSTETREGKVNGSWVFHGRSLLLQDCVPGESLLLSFPATTEQLCPTAVPVQDLGESFGALDVCSSPHIKTQSFNKQCLRCMPEVFRKMYRLSALGDTSELCAFSQLYTSWAQQLGAPPSNLYSCDAWRPTSSPDPRQLGVGWNPHFYQSPGDWV